MIGYRVFVAEPLEVVTSINQPSALEKSLFCEQDIQCSTKLACIKQTTVFKVHFFSVHWLVA